MQSLKTVSAIFLYQQMISIRKLRKMFFISSKKFFYSQDIEIFIIFSSLLFQPLLQRIIQMKSQSLQYLQLAKQEFKNILFDILRRKEGLIFFKNCYLAVPWPTNMMLITAL